MWRSVEKKLRRRFCLAKRLLSEPSDSIILRLCLGANERRPLGNGGRFWM